MARTGLLKARATEQDLTRKRGQSGIRVDPVEPVLEGPQDGEDVLREDIGQDRREDRDDRAARVFKCRLDLCLMSFCLTIFD